MSFLRVFFYVKSAQCILFQKFLNIWYKLLSVLNTDSEGVFLYRSLKQVANMVLRVIHVFVT